MNKEKLNAAVRKYWTGILSVLALLLALLAFGMSFGGDGYSSPSYLEILVGILSTLVTVLVVFIVSNQIFFEDRMRKMIAEKLEEERKEIKEEIEENIGKAEAKLKAEIGESTETMKTEVDERFEKLERDVYLNLFTLYYTSALDLILKEDYTYALTIMNLILSLSKRIDYFRWDSTFTALEICVDSCSINDVTGENDLEMFQIALKDLKDLPEDKKGDTVYALISKLQKLIKEAQAKLNPEA